MTEKCLVIERDASTAAMITAVLRRSFPWEIVNVSTISEGAVKLQNDDSFKAVVADISTSSDDLSALTAQTRRLRSGVVLVSTRRLSRKMLELFVSDDVYSVLPKPFDVEELVSSLRGAVEFAQTGSKMAAHLFGFLKDVQE